MENMFQIEQLESMIAPESVAYKIGYAVGSAVRAVLSIDLW
ncbi:hypothetical protein [Paenibacillus xylaniclasticus]|nr:MULTISPECIES: hypothetical protein [Paenibacillus]GFN32737.1 hypothetical protein PCURB6_29970 [Paenibacillus curdlanolyticus]